MITPGFCGNLPATMGRYRWLVCLLLFLATTINYVDRQILALVKPILDDQLGWTNAEYGRVNAAFQGAYAVGLLAVRPARRPRRHEAGLCPVDHGVEPGGDRARAGGQRRRFLQGAHRAGRQRRRQLPVGDQGGRVVVPAAGARARHRPVQFGRQRGRRGRAGRGAVDRAHLRLARGVRRRRLRGLALARALDPVLRRARKDPAPEARRAGAHPQRRRRAGRATARRSAG